MILEFSGFDSYLALKGISFEDKAYFFSELEESVISLVELDDDDMLKQEFIAELAINKQRMTGFRLKLGHKNLIINLCRELQKTNLDEFNAYISFAQNQDAQQHQSPPPLILASDLAKSEEDHGYSRENEIEDKKPVIEQDLVQHLQEDEEEAQNNHSLKDQFEEMSSPPHHVTQSEQIEYVYDTDDTEGGNFIEHEYLETDQYVDEETAVVEYHEVQVDDADAIESEIYNVEQMIKSEEDEELMYDQSNDCFELTFDQTQHHHQRSMNRSLSSLNGQPKSKKPRHMYTSEFLTLQQTTGRIGTPGRRRPKIQKQYSETDEGYLDRWSDLVRQSCEVIVPHDLLSQYDLSIIEIVKILPNIWEVKCPLCTKKLRLQSTQEGKYMNYKRSNFERHLRIVHYKQIAQFKEEPDTEEVTST